MNEIIRNKVVNTHLKIKCQRTNKKHYIQMKNYKQKNNNLIHRLIAKQVNVEEVRVMIN